MAMPGTLLCTQIWLIVAAVTSQLTQEQRDSILTLHNTYRASVKPEAADMTRMAWCDECTLLAEQYAPKCIWKHNPEVENMFGENLFITTGPLNVNEVLSNWFDESMHYDYHNNSCSVMCGHYTQVVWAKTTLVGCAAHVCATVDGLDMNNSTLVVCNYLPPGNEEGHKPYQAGEPCSQCPEKQTVCEDNLCDTIHADAIPNTQSGTETEHADIDNKAPTAVLMFATPAAVSLMLAGLLASLMF